MNGLELALRIKNSPATNHLPVIMLSAKGFELSAEQLREEYGVVKLLCKPFSPRELFGVVEGLLEGQDAGGAPVTAGAATNASAAVSQWL
jgi:DNA-binding response OmpR family regulator